MKYSFFDDLKFEKEDKKLFKCLATVSKACSKIFLSTKDRRICSRCSETLHDIENPGDTRYEKNKS